jgi:hypothetical protein
VALELRPVASGNAGAPLPFSLPLICDGTPQGRLEGSLELIWPASDEVAGAELLRRVQLVGHHQRTEAAAAMAVSARAGGRGGIGLFSGRPAGAGGLGLDAAGGGGVDGDDDDACDTTAEPMAASARLASNSLGASGLSALPRPATFPELSEPSLSQRPLRLSPAETAALAEADMLPPQLALALLRGMQLGGLFRDRSHFLRKHHNVATGMGVIDFLLAKGWCHDRDHGRRIGAELIDARMIAHAVRKGDDFKDKAHSFYRVTDRIGFKEGGMAARVAEGLGLGSGRPVRNQSRANATDLASMRKTRL